MAEGGLVVANNDTIRSFLLSAAAARSGGDGSLGTELRDLASSLSSQSSVPYRSLRAIWLAIPAAERPPLRRLFDGADFVFSSPKPREKVRTPLCEGRPSTCFAFFVFDLILGFVIVFGGVR